MYAYANFTQLSPKAGLGKGAILQAKISIDKSIHNSPRHEMVRMIKEKKKNALKIKNSTSFPFTRNFTLTLIDICHRNLFGFVVPATISASKVSCALLLLLFLEPRGILCCGFAGVEVVKASFRLGFADSFTDSLRVLSDAAGCTGP